MVHPDSPLSAAFPARPKQMSQPTSQRQSPNLADSRLRRWLYVGLGLGSLVLGLVGVAVPLLPTTPFLLLSAACFMRGSDRLYRWLLGSRWLGGYIRNYREHRAMTPWAKTCALVLLWGALGYSAAAATESRWVRAMLATVAVGVTIHLLRLRTVSRAPAPDGGGEGDSHGRPVPTFHSSAEQPVPRWRCNPEPEAQGTNP